ncbi:MerR family transcriptional regulator [Mycolicibacterium mucogenicum]|uniref:MerR family transcriptional regulator n=1 Tax=Mycolicibacterium mucogenicum TaxID=56689 RepID=UPI000A87ACD9|nr:XRE family transcriptional regulator [Mycolicibacterium mucogenicum]
MIHYLSLAEFAERVQLSQNTIKSYYRKGLLPTPDAVLGRSRGWLPETVAS